MKTVNIHLAKTQLSRLIAEVVAGGDVVLAKAGKPRVRLVAVAASQGSRPLGSVAGQVVELDDCWTSDPEVEALFSDGELEPPAPHRVAERARTRATSRAVKDTAKGAVKPVRERAVPKKP